MDDTPIELTTEDGAGQRIDRFLAAKLPQFSRGRLQRWITLGVVSCDTRALQPKTKLSGAEHLTIVPQPLEADAAFVPEAVPLDIRYQDTEVIVLAKPAGLVVHPAAGNWHGTMMQGLLHRFPELDQLPRAGIVHRLDKETSGLLAVARTEASRINLIEQLAARTVKRDYLAVCHGAVTEAVEIDKPIGRDRHNRLRMAVRVGGKEAQTHCEPLATILFEGKPLTLIHCRLRTGRTHQIRVHLASIGHAIVADPLYGGQAIATMSRQALHAFKLAFDHPAGGEAGPFIEKLPADFGTMLATLGLFPDAAWPDRSNLFGDEPERAANSNA